MEWFKIENCFFALENGVKEIFIGNQNIINDEKIVQKSPYHEKITNSAISLLKELIRTESFSSEEEKTSLYSKLVKQHEINFKTYMNNVYAQ